MRIRQGGWRMGGCGDRISGDGERNRISSATHTASRHGNSYELLYPFTRLELRILCSSCYSNRSMSWYVGYVHK